MNKKIYALIFLLIIIILLIMLINFNTVFAKKYYIQFKALDKVTVAYKSDGWSSADTSSKIEMYEVDITDKEFLNLIEKTYQNKIFNDYNTNILFKGKYKIIINDNIELCTSDYEKYFCLDYNGKWLRIKSNKEVYNKMVEIISEEANKTSDITNPIAISTGKEISNYNSKFESYIGINDSNKANDLLSYCIKNYLEHNVEWAFVPTIIYKSENGEKKIEFNKEDLSMALKETEYYNSLNELIKNLSLDKHYKVEVKYDTTKAFDNVFILNEIDITEIM